MPLNRNPEPTLSPLVEFVEVVCSAVGKNLRHSPPQSTFFSVPLYSSTVPFFKISISHFIK